MNTKQTNQITMFKTVASYLDLNESVWNQRAPFVTAVAEFKAKIAAIDATVQKQETPIGAAEEKADARNELEDELFLMCEALAVLGHKGNDHDLTALTSISRTSLDRLGDEELSNRAVNVLTEANARETELATFGVTEANITELEQALERFNTSKASPRTATAARVVQTESLPVQIRDLSGMLRNQIDKMVNLFRRTKPEFVAGYRAARVIVDRAASHRTTKTAGTSPAPPSP